MHRPPADLRLPDYSEMQNGQIYTTANLLYMFGLTDDPAFEVQRLLQELPRCRNNGRIAPGADALYLMRHGFSQQGISCFDTHRLLTEGAGYLQEYYRRSPAWSHDLEAFEIANLVDKQESARQFQQEAGELGFREDVRQPLREDIIYLLEEGYVVNLTVATRGDHTMPFTQSVLVHQVSQNEVHGYWPSFSGSAILGGPSRPFGFDDLCNWWDGLSLLGWKKD
jgi:hypothetical protein